MRLEALALCRDPEALRLLRRVLPDLGINVNVCGRAEEAGERLKRRKFDALVVDCDVPGGPEALQTLRTGTSNRSCIVFALIAGTGNARRAFELGANFVLDKPLSLDRTMRGFRAGHGLMVREARRYYRHRLELPITVDFGSGVVQQFTTVNLSEGGLALRAPRRLPLGATLRIRLIIPQGPVIEANGEVSWAGGDGRAGIRMTAMSDACREELTAWLGRVYEREEASAPGFLPSSGIPVAAERRTIQ